MVSVLIALGTVLTLGIPRDDGAKAGVIRLQGGSLSVAQLNHWGALGDVIEVEPFARYRVRCRVRGNVKTGMFFAPYCYEWDSYEWAFLSNGPVTGSVPEWTWKEVTFVSPYSRMHVHPLAYIDAADSEASVEDVTVEKIGEPKEVMAEMEARGPRDETEARLLARWYIRTRRPAAAERLMTSASGLLRADIATVLALAATNPEDRKRFAREAVAAGGPTYHDGVVRFEQMTAGMTPAERLQILEAALRDPSDKDRGVRGVALVLERLVRPETGPATLRQRQAQLAAVRRAVDRMVASASGKEIRASLQAVLTTIEKEEAAVEQEKAKLGKCSLIIGGKKVTPQTHAIVLPDRASEVERYAARELQHHLELVTGAVLPILRESGLGKAIGLFVGRCRTHADPKERLKPEGLRIRTIGPALRLTGNGRGVLYAVYTFLEDHIGCRWFTPDCRTWPQSGTIRIGSLDRTYAPPLEYRGGDYPVARPGEFAARVRLNGANHHMTREQGGNVGVHSLAHTFAALCPPEKYFAEHPEYFSLVNGKRQSGYAQLCLTNPEVLQIVIEGVRRWIRENPHMTVFSVSQNDTFNYCECPECTRVAEEEGSQAGPMLRFVNAVADAIAKEHPNVAIETLAYQYTRKPPRITKPRSNVIICLCSIECCFIHPLETCPDNASFVEDIKGWNRICNRLWIWDYVINYAHSICPFPNLYVLKPNIQFYIKNGVKGIYEESCYFTKGSELQELRNYIIAKTLWDPNYDTDKAIDEFCAAYYGPAAPHIRRYINLIHRETQKDPALHVRIYTHPRDYVTPEMIREARTLFDEAEAAVRSDPVRLHRVQVARLPILYAEIVLAQSGHWVEEDGRLVQRNATNIGALAQEFERIARAEGVSMVREGGPDAPLDAWLKSLPKTQPSLEVLRLKGGGLELDILPGLGGRIWRMRRSSDGADLMAVAGEPDRWQPNVHGYEEYSETGYRSPGWHEVYEVKERSDRHVVLEAALPNGLRMSRRIELASDDAAVLIMSTVTNATSQPRAVAFRTHPCFASAFGAGSVVEIRRSDGTVRTVDLLAPGPQETSVWLQGEDVPGGEWSVVDPSRDLRLSVTFDASEVEQCLLNWSAPDRRVNLELFTREHTLSPGDSLTLRQTWRVTGR